ncbi:MAG: PEP-utilizing enzyme [Kofleriaceae bacterium]
MTDRGGLLSHAAIVAREYGCPLWRGRPTARPTTDGSYLRTINDHCMVACRRGSAR